MNKKNNEEWILLSLTTVAESGKRLMVQGVEQGLLLGAIGSWTNLARQPPRGDMVHPVSN